MNHFIPIFDIWVFYLSVSPSLSFSPPFFLARNGGIFAITAQEHPSFLYISDQNQFLRSDFSDVDMNYNKSTKKNSKDSNYT